MRTNVTPSSRALPGRSATGALVVALAVGAIAAGAARAQDEPPAEDEDRRPIETMAECRSVDVAGKLIEARAGRTTLELAVTERTAVVEHRVVPITDVESGEPITILARLQESQRVPDSTAKISPRYVQVLAVVVGEFEPPPLTEEQREDGVDWVRGKAGIGEKGARLLNGTLVQVGPDRKVLALVPREFAEAATAEEGSRPLLRKGATLRLAGTRPPEEDGEGASEREKRKAPQRVDAVRIEILARGFDAKEYAAILGTARRGK